MRQLPIFLLKLFHKGCQLGDTLHGHGVIDAGPHTANRAVALQVDKACFRSSLDKLGVHLRISGDEGGVHQGTVLLLGGALK